MTFTEAAVEVLKLVGKPLHYKKITEIAIERNLLSHVGKTPEITMSSRLATMVKKDRGDAPIVKVKPGVFGLREFSAEVLEAAESESGHEYELPEPRRETEGGSAVRKGGGEEPQKQDASAEDGGGKGKGATPLPGADVFPEEDDDDEPILAKIGEEEAKRGDRGEGKKRKRRRRKRKSGEQREGGDEQAEAQPARKARGAVGRGGASGKEVRGDWTRLPAEDEPRAQDLADAVEAVLGGGARKPLDHARIAELLIKRGRLTGDPRALAPTVAAAILGDEARRGVEGRRPRFRSVSGGVALTDWELPNEAVRAEQDARRAAERQREAVHRAFIRRLSDMPATAFMELVAAWLNAEGVSSLRGVRPPSKGGYHLAGTLRHGGQETRVAVAIWRDGTQLGREHVIEMRGALHHYGNASMAWLLTMNRVQSGAWEEAAVAGQAPCILYDGVSIAAGMERLGIGLRRVAVPVSTMDFELLEKLTPSRQAIEEYAGERTAPEPSDDDDVQEGEQPVAKDDAQRRPRRRRRRGGAKRSQKEDEARSEESPGAGDGVDVTTEAASHAEGAAEGDNGAAAGDEEPSRDAGAKKRALEDAETTSEDRDEAREITAESGDSDRSEPEGP